MSRALVFPAAIAASAAVLTACAPEPENSAQTQSVQIDPPAPTETSTQKVVGLPEPTQETIDELRAISASGSIRSLARFANGQENFRSNIGPSDPYDHWYLMKRAGLDPAEKLVEILDYPYVEKDFGDERLYVWPYLADRSPSELSPEQLSFKERADLLALVGRQGIEEIANGSPYPGFRTAISSTGEWRYFVHNR